ncbi:MAG TPA: CAP domain-containing protein [Anaerolineae bacterium]|nr:CAP domain-containing protein [Anaerolineae bacterium]
MRKLGVALACLTGLALLSTFSPPGGGTPSQAAPSQFVAHLPLVLGGLHQPPPTPTYEQQVVELINEKRASQGLPPLKICPELMAAAAVHSQDMATHNFVDHTGSDGSSPWDRFRREGYELTWGGETIAAGPVTPQEVVAGWMESDGHREILLISQFREIGVGYASSAFGHFWTMDLGAREDVYPVVIEGEALIVTSPRVALYIYGDGWADEMMVSNDAAFVGAAWEAYAPAKVWRLDASSGWKTVHIQLKHKDGAILSAADGIYLDLSHSPGPPYP